MKTKFLTLVAAGALFAGGIGSGIGGGSEAQAQPPEDFQGGGAAGLVAAVVGIQTDDIDIDVLNSSLNNVNVVRNVLNNSPILNNNDVDVNVLTIEDALNNNVITLEDLVDLDVDIDDVVAVVELLGGGVLVLT